MLWQAIGGLLPLAVGVALSPLPVIAVILVLATPRGRANGGAFAVGWVAGLVVVSVIVLLVTSGASDPDSATADGVAWGRVLLGVGFLALALRQWRTRPGPGETAELPKWMAAVDGLTAARSGAIGFALSAVNPKNLALTLAAAASISQADLSTGNTAVAVAVFVIVASLTVAGPVVASLVAPDAAAHPLESIREFMAAHNAVIMMVLLVVLGAKLIGDGLAGVT